MVAKKIVRQKRNLLALKLWSELLMLRNLKNENKH